MALTCSSLQPLSGRYGRRLLTFQKVLPYDKEASAAWREGRRGFVMSIEKVADMVWEAKPDGKQEVQAGDRKARSKQVQREWWEQQQRQRQQEQQHEQRQKGEGDGDGGSGGNGGGGNGRAGVGLEAEELPMQGGGKEVVKELASLHV